MDDNRRSHVHRQISTLVFSQVDASSPMAHMRSAAWFNRVTSLGIHVPLFVIHDIGLLLASPQGTGGWDLKKQRNAPHPPRVQKLAEEYRELLVQLAESEIVRKVSGWRPRDELISVLLVRLLGDVYARWGYPGKRVAQGELPLDLSLFTSLDPHEIFQDYDPQLVWNFLDHLVGQSLHVTTSIELIDLDTVKLLGMFREDSARGVEGMVQAVDVVDLFAALGSPTATDISSFSLELLPSVLETKRASGLQRFSVDGFASIERSGKLDSLVLSELAHDREIFEQKVVDNELLYYAHEREKEDEKRLQYILVDSSASMRGKRQVFARGLALALVKKLLLAGDEVWFRFFDSRAHELIKSSRNSSFPVPHVLSFRSELGRNYAKVFQQLSVELTRLHLHARRRVVLYIITHGQCHIPNDIVMNIARHAYVYGIFILPSSEVAVEFLPHLDRYQIVDEQALVSKARRRDRALDIVQDAEGSLGDMWGAAGGPGTGGHD